MRESDGSWAHALLEELDESLLLARLRDRLGQAESIPDDEALLRIVVLLFVESSFPTLAGRALLESTVDELMPALRAHAATRVRLDRLVATCRSQAGGGA